MSNNHNQNDSSAGQQISDVERFLLNLSNALLGFASRDPPDTDNITNALSRAHQRTTSSQQRDAVTSQQQINSPPHMNTRSRNITHNNTTT